MPADANRTTKPITRTAAGRAFMRLPCGTQLDKRNCTLIKNRTNVARYSFLGEFGVPASSARGPVPMPCEEHARTALGAALPLARDPTPIDLVELSLQAGSAFVLLRLGHHVPSLFFASGFFSGFFSSFFSSFFSAGFFSSLGAGFFSSFAGAFSAFPSAFASGFGASGLGAAAGFSAFGAGAGFSGLGAASFFSLTSGSINLLRSE